MNALLRTGFAFVLLLCSGAAHAKSSVLFEEKKKETITLSSFQNRELGALVAELGKTNTHRSGNVQLPVEFERHLKISREYNTVHVTASVDEFWVSQKILFQEFDFADALTPTTWTSKIELLGPDGKVLQTFNVQNRSINSTGKTVLVQTSFQDSTSFRNYKLKVVEQNLGFSSENQKALQKRLALVKQYYQAETRLAQLARDLQAINPTDVDQLPRQSDNLAVLEQALDHAFRGGLDRGLDLDKHDPLQLKRKFRDLDGRFRERRLVIEQTYARLPEIFYSRGLELAMNRNLTAARVYFERSVQANPAFAPAHVQLARLDLSSGYLPEAAQRTKEILNRLQPDPETFRFAQEVALDIQNAYVRQAEALNDQGKFAQALQQFEAARDYCRSISSLRCRTELWENGMGIAKTGIYNQLLQDARQALRQSRLDQAAQLTQEAQQYARSNQTAIATDAEAQRLMRDIQQQVYQHTMTDGRKALREKQFSQALAAFEKAKAGALAYSLNPEPLAENLLRQAAKPVLLAQIADGRKYASLNQLPQARAQATQINNLLVKYGLVNDRDLDFNFRALSKAIFSQECANAQIAVDQFYQKAQQLSAQGKFEQAALELDKAIAGAQENGSCGISSAAAEAELTRIDAPARYQELVSEAKALMAKTQTGQALKVYQDAETHFVEHGVARFGLRDVGLVEFALASQDKCFLAEVARHAASHGKATDAIVILKKLSDLKLARYNRNKLQVLIGEALAIRDAGDNRNANYKQMAAAYIGGAKDLKKLEKAYLKKFKKLI